MELIPIDPIAQKILLIRGNRVMLDSDLAELYKVPIKRLNEQVRRNTRRFPPDFRVNGGQVLKYKLKEGKLGVMSTPFTNPTSRKI